MEDDVSGARSAPLERRLGLGDAVVVGAGSMIGAGVFVAWAPAAKAAGSGLLVGLAFAAVVAWCNATSSAQLAAAYPESGGTYVYARHRLGPAWGHLAGAGFVIGKTASCSAVALSAGTYLWPSREREGAVLAVILVTAVNLGGLSRTVVVTKVVLACSLATLVTVVVVAWVGRSVDLGRLNPAGATPLGVLRSGGFLFFAFAGYARIATLGEEVRDPERTIPRAIPRALLAVLAVYVIVAASALVAVPPGRLAAADAPLRLVFGDRPLAGLETVVGIGAGIATFGVLLNLIPGVSRTILAMARRTELPRWFAHVDERRALPVRAELTVAAAVLVLVLVLELRSAIAVSGVAVLGYYALTNASALTLSGAHRRWPRPVAWLGLVGCLLLMASLPPGAILGGSTVLAAAAALRRLTGGRAE